MNNYERIKAMSIDEMAEYITSPDGDFSLFCRNFCCPSEFPNETDCKNCRKKWLESEVE